MSWLSIDLLKTPHPDDLIWKAVNHILPANEPSAFAVGLQLFASALVILATLKLGYFIIINIAIAAKEGSTLNTKYNAIWGPLAVVFGFGLLIPLPYHHGLTAGHWILRQAIALPSVNMFNVVAVGVAEYQIRDGRPIAPIAIHGKEFAWSVVHSEVCSYVLTQAATRHELYGIIDRVPPVPPASIGAIFGNKISWDWGPQCGSISLSYPTVEEFGEFGATRNAAAKKLIDDVRKIEVHKGLVIQLEQVGMNPARVDSYSQESFVDIYKKAGFLVEELTAQINAIGATYEKTVADAAAKQGTAGQTEQRQKLVDGVRTYGGTVLFSYFRMLSQLNEKAAAYSSEKPDYVAPQYETWGTSSSMKAEVEYAFKLIQNQRTLESKSIKLTGDDVAFAGEQESGVFADIINSITHPFIDYLTAYDGWKADPVADLMNVGSRLMTSAKVGFGIGMTATGASNFWSSTAGKIVEYGMTPVWPLLMLMYVGGVMLSIVLPNLPLIYAIFGVTAFALELIVASIAVLVWAFMHARLDHGDGFVSSHSAPGYKIMFGLFLRLPINMLAFIAATAANAAVLNIFLFVWSFAFRGSQGGEALGIASIIAAFAVSMYIQWKIAVFMFSLNSNLNEKVAQWFGHAVQSMGESMQGNTVVAGLHTNAGAGASAKPMAGSNGKPKTDKPSNENNGGGRRNLTPPPAEK